VPREVSAVIARCLKKNPAERYRTAGELLADARKLSAAVSKPGVNSGVSDAAAEYAEAKAAGGWKVWPLLIGAAAVVVVLAVVGVVALVVFSSSDAAADAPAAVAANAANTSNTARGLTSSAPAPGAARDASERTVEITVNDGHADVYDGESKLGTTPYAVRGKLGERVRLTLRRDGYTDEPVDFVVGEKKAYMYSLSKK